MWYDPQQQPPLGYCRICGGEVYRDGFCGRCERRRVVTEDD